MAMRTFSYEEKGLRTESAIPPSIWEEIRIAMLRPCETYGDATPQSGGGRGVSCSND